MHRVKNKGKGRRLYTKAYQHGNYIRPTYVAVWTEAARQAEEHGVSLSEFISHALYVFMTGRAPEDGKLSGHKIVVRKEV